MTCGNYLWEVILDCGFEGGSASEVSQQRVLVYANSNWEAEQVAHKTLAKYFGEDTEIITNDAGDKLYLSPYEESDGTIMSVKLASIRGTLNFNNVWTMYGTMSFDPVPEFAEPSGDVKDRAMNVLYNALLMNNRDDDYWESINGEWDVNINRVATKTHVTLYPVRNGETITKIWFTIATLEIDYSGFNHEIS